ncbi:hypothetical protein [Methylomonas rhizoryzae]|uniref:hypothetical protein n=1 Tax=Methylomonas rhizoryzae TaxID=2608981 RepID=UPI001231C7DF|nr:hypothetical protein [Methylomonas rhizoryzae]
MNIKSRIAQLEKQGQATGDREQIKAQLEKILFLAKSTPRMELEPKSICWLSPKQSNAGKIFLSLFKEYGVAIK